MIATDIFEGLKGRLIVSCQAEEGSPFDSPEGVCAFAECAVTGGAAAIRSCGVEKTDYLIRHIPLPVIGLTKSHFDDGFVRITGSFAEVEQLIGIRTPLIAVDGTFRPREGALTGPEYIRTIKERWPNVKIMADISTSEEAVACRQAGADCVSTTLCGYTPHTAAEAAGGPSVEMLRRCVEALPGCPVFAEGRYNTPAEAASAIEAGAWAVVVGSAITRPHLITRWFADALERSRGKNLQQL
ncbi:MAG: N-acetylmannosamine-6-phosphate 2-epimerase [Alistipes sp.]|nr:N-acetylmannosamine-6-phosphate 2-epimerase [Alistipes sp.]